MCGIVGFTGKQQAAPILLDGLSKLEYRGYDSAGLAVRDGKALAQVVKAKGRLNNLAEKTDGGKTLKGTCGIGHTRWEPTGNPVRLMPIRMCQEIVCDLAPARWNQKWLESTTGLLKTIQN